MSGAEQAVVTNLDESIWEYVLEEATDELLGGDGATLELISGRLFVRESDLAIMEVAEPVVSSNCFSRNRCNDFSCLLFSMVENQKKILL